MIYHEIEFETVLNSKASGEHAKAQIDTRRGEFVEQQLKQEINNYSTDDRMLIEVRLNIVQN